MKAVVVHQYGDPEVLKFEEYPDPVPGAGLLRNLWTVARTHHKCCRCLSHLDNWSTGASWQ
jgi:hypothetical protein